MNKKLNIFEFNKIGYFKYKPRVPSIAGGEARFSMPQYPISEFLINKIKNNEIEWEIETEKQEPKLFKGKFIVLI